MIISVSTAKGGEGKTTTAYFLGSYLIRNGHKVLFVDMDPQNSLSFLLFQKYNIAYDDDMVDISKFLVDPARNQPIFLCENADILPSSFKLASLRTMGSNFLKNKLSTILHKYEYVVIDTSPSFDNFFIASNYAADIVVYPIYIRSNMSIKTFLISMRQLKEEGHVDIISKFKLLCTKYDHTETEDYYISSLREAIEDNDDSLFFKTKIPFSRRLINVQNNPNNEKLKTFDMVMDLYKPLFEEIINS